jgi:hypothetical protein
MVRGLILAIALLATTATSAQNLVPPEVVQLENVLTEGDMRRIYVGNTNHHYLLYCNIKATGGCITPEENKNYLMFNASTRWKMPGAKDFLTLDFIQDFTVKYNKGENIGLVPEDGKGDIGLFILDPTEGGYERDTLISDGPITYGVGLSDADRQKAWKNFFMQMVQAVVRQQGKDALDIMLARRCMPGQDFCMIGLDANFIGIGGIQEPRKVLLMVTTDVHDQNKQLLRSVCTYPAKDTIICREWDTGKLISAEHAQQ